MGLGPAWVAKGLQGAGAAPWTTICPRVATEPSSLGTPGSSSLCALGKDATGCDPKPCWSGTPKGADSPLAAHRSHPWRFPCTCTADWIRNDPMRQEDDLPPHHAGVRLWHAVLSGGPRHSLGLTLSCAL